MSKRFCQTLELKNDPELIKKYVEAHDREHHWSEIRDGIRSVGIEEMEIYILGNRLFMIVETPDDFNWDEAMARLATLPRQAEWGGIRRPVPGLRRQCHERREMADDGADVLVILIKSLGSIYSLRHPIGTTYTPSSMSLTGVLGSDNLPN